MPRKPRQPSQQRSRATVDAIIEAGFVCVARSGVAHTTTRHIAEAAGIGVGSLYEYFANKQAVLDAMNRRFVDDVAQLIRDVTPKVVAQDAGPATRTLLDAFGEFLTRNDGRYLKVAGQVMQADVRDYVEPVSKALMDLVVQYLMNHPAYTQLGNIPTMSYIFINAGIFSVLRQLSAENPPITYAQLSAGLADLVEYHIAQDLARSRAAKTDAPKRRPDTASRRRPATRART